MRNFISMPLIFVLMAFLSFKGASQTISGEGAIKPVEKPLELVLGIPKLSDKLLPDLISIIESTKGLSYVKYCEEHKLVLLQYERAVYPRKEAVVKAIKEREFYPSIFIKETSFSEAEELCSEQNNGL